MNTYELIKVGLDATNQRNQTIANNIANINTPGYKRQYVEFEKYLENDEVKIETKTDNISAQRLDGNNVDIESEKVSQAKTTLEYNALINLANTKIAMSKNVILGR